MCNITGISNIPVIITDPILFSAMDAIHKLLKELPVDTSDQVIHCITVVFSSLYSRVNLGASTTLYRLFLPPIVWDRIDQYLKSNPHLDKVSEFYHILQPQNTLTKSIAFDQSAYTKNNEDDGDDDSHDGGGGSHIVANSSAPMSSEVLYKLPDLPAPITSQKDSSSSSSSGLYLPEAPSIKDNDLFDALQSRLAALQSGNDDPNDIFDDF